MTIEWEKWFVGDGSTSFILKNLILIKKLSLISHQW